MSFFSIDRILEEEEVCKKCFNVQKIPVLWNVEVQGLGSLKPPSSSQSSQNSQQMENAKPNLKAGSKTEIPLWLAGPLTSRGYVKAQPPRFMNTFARRQLEADVQEKNLQAESPYYFDIVDAVAQCLEYTNAQDQDVQPSQDSQSDKPQNIDVAKFRDDFSNAFVRRYAMILSKCYGHLQKSDYSSFVQKLTILERAMYEAGRKGVEKYESWKGSVGSFKVISTNAQAPQEDDEPVTERASKRRAI